jgi:hypothetical protein
MWKYVLERVILIFITAFIILSLSFFLLKLVPNNPVGTNIQLKAFWDSQVALGFAYRVADGIGVTADHNVEINNITYYYNDYSISHQYDRVAWQHCHQMGLGHFDSCANRFQRHVDYL